MSAEQKRLLSLNNDKVDQADMAEMMFNNIGACFNQLQKRASNIKLDKDQEATLKSPASFVSAIFKLCKQLLVKDLMNHYDTLAGESAHFLGSNPYKSFTEPVNFIATSLLRELLQASAGKYKKNISICFQK